MGAILLGHQQGESMPDENPVQPSVGMWTMILTDVHFWVPAIVLLFGLAVLYWIR